MNKSLLATVVALACLAAPAAQAQWFLGGAAGWTRGDYDCSGLSTCDRSGTGYKLYGGYAYGGELAIEVSYFNWGEARVAGTVADGSGTLPAAYDEQASGWGLGGAYLLPMGPDWHAVFRAGLAYNEGRTTATLGSQTGSDRFSTTYPYVGVAFGFNLSPGLVLTTEGDFSRVKFLDDRKANVGLLSIGLRFMF